MFPSDAPERPMVLKGWGHSQPLRLGKGLGGYGVLFPGHLTLPHSPAALAPDAAAGAPGAPGCYRHLYMRALLFDHKFFASIECYLKNMTVIKYFIVILTCISLLVRLNTSHVYYSVKCLLFVQ